MSSFPDHFVSDTDLKLAAQKQQAYLESQMGTPTGTIHDFGQKERSPNNG